MCETITKLTKMPNTTHFLGWFSPGILWCPLCATGRPQRQVRHFHCPDNQHCWWCSRWSTWGRRHPPWPTPWRSRWWPCSTVSASVATTWPLLCNPRLKDAPKWNSNWEARVNRGQYVSADSLFKLVSSKWTFFSLSLFFIIFCFNYVCLTAAEYFLSNIVR